jgi:DNA mismatch repair protein MutL
MNRIRLLPEQVANQIAAGEVVERPASVVKELVENSLDARATRITVEIQAGGRSLIRVTDDGVGMGRDDALLCLERHATSKIKKAEDLSSIATMGFRGEALPSIASVSRMTMTTREREGEGEPDAGTQVIIHGGKLLEVKAAGCAPGATMEVRQLFFNLPARRKFLRTEETERAHIQHYLTLVALAYPEVGLTFVQNGRVIWQLPGLDLKTRAKLDLVRERLEALYGNGLKLLPVDFSARSEGNGEEPGLFRIWGFIGAPGVSRGTREDQHLFVNRRPVENRGLNFALLEGYHTALMKGRFPVCCLFLEIDPAEVDVNIHPSKREIKFHREQWVRRWVTEAVRERLLQFASRPGGDQHGTEPAPNGETLLPTAGNAAPEFAGHRPASDGPDGAAPEKVESESLPGPGEAAPSPVTKELSAAAEKMAAAHHSVVSQPQFAWRKPESQPATGEVEAAPASLARSTPTPSATAPISHEPVPLLNVPLRLAGVIGKLYVVLESDRGLVLLDQHAAHERILFEQMLGRLEQGNAPSQRLLLPETLELSPRDTEFLRGQLATLSRLGVGLSEFGDRTFLLDALPPFVKAPDARRFVLELVDELKSSGEGINTWRLGEHTVAKTVCRHAVKANDPLSEPELENLVNDLRECKMPYTCPHGRPTLIEMNYRELEKKFGRSA